MFNQHQPTPDADQPIIYHIRLKEHLGEQWQEWFEDMTITHTASNETLIIATIIDQAQLFGLLKKVRNLGLTLIEVTRATSDNQE